MFRKILAAFAAILVTAAISYGASIPLLTNTSGCSESSQLLSCINQLIRSINTNITSNSVASVSTPRNYLDNGGMAVTQRLLSSADTICAVNAAPTSLTFAADRWACQRNIAVADGHFQVITAAPAPPTGFVASTKIWRAANVLTQPVCLQQAIPLSDSTQLASKQVMLSAYVQPLGAGAALNNVTLQIITGTGAVEQGLLVAPTASPALTPAWTGIATNGATAFATTNGAWNRYNTAPVALPAATTQVGVEICYTPNNTNQAAGATDGVAITGVQLEVVSPGATTPGPFEFRRFQDELRAAQRYYWQLADNQAATFRIAGFCQGTITATAAECVLFNPVRMRAAPTVVVLTATSFGVRTGAATATPCTALAIIGSTSTLDTAGALTCTSAAGSTLLAAEGFTYSNTGVANSITVSADM